MLSSSFFSVISGHEQTEQFAQHAIQSPKPLAVIP